MIPLIILDYKMNDNIILILNFLKNYKNQINKNNKLNNKYKF